ncbi:MAG TPA: hypothetical protein VI423_02190 [Paenisporosarcina sp.]|nr:hypothetical protein [Paenisporosarcina sp.]
MAAIKETYSAPDVDMTPRWEVKSGPMTPAILQNSAVSIHAGESLFVGTEGYNSTVDSSCCYVTWKGYRPGSRFTE